MHYSTDSESHACMYLIENSSPIQYLSNYCDDSNNVIEYGAPKQVPFPNQ